MSASAWSALADRFAALAAEQEFEFNTYPIGNPPPAVAGPTPHRFRLIYQFGYTPSAPTSTAVVVGTGSPQPGEFAMINRFRWLSWAAGLLLGADSTTPAELQWWVHLHAPRSQPGAAPTDLTTVPALVRSAADAARQFATAGSRPITTSPRRKTNNWPAIQGEFRILRERFNSPQWHTVRPEVALTAFPSHEAAEQWNRTMMPGPTDQGSWSSHGTVWGDPSPVDAFVALANDAGTSLPCELSFTPPLFPSFNPLGNMNPDRGKSWLEFLFLECPSAFTHQDDTPTPGSRVARPTSSPFIISVNAIDEVLGADAPAFLRQFRDSVARFNPWFEEEDRVAALAAIEAATRVATSPPEGVRRGVHWTEFPEQVEGFGDLLSILETLDRHDDEEGFTGQNFESESDDSAYTVDLHDEQYRFNPRLDRMPGLERLLDLFGVDDSFTLVEIRELRRRVMSALKLDRAAIGAMTFIQIAGALDEAARPVSPASPPTDSTPPSCAVLTFGELLANVRSVEEAAAATRAEADTMSGAPGSMHLRIQAEFFEADAEYKKHLAFPALEAYTNAHYGLVTFENLVRVRGAICELLRCGSSDADLLSLDEAIQILDCPGAPFLDPPPAPSTGTQDTAPYSLAAALSRITRHLRVWHETDYQEPIPTVATGSPDVMAINRQTFRDAIRPFRGRKRPGEAIRIIRPPVGKEDGLACAEPERDTEKPLTLWLLADFDQKLRRAPRGGVSDYLCGILDQLLGMPAWICVAPNPELNGFEQSLASMGKLIQAGRRVDGTILGALESAVGRLIDFSSNLPAKTTPDADWKEAQDPAARKQKQSLSERQKLILTEMLTAGAVGNTKKTTRNEVVRRIDKKKTGADFARDFGALKEANYTDSDTGPDGGVWLTGKGKTKAEELKKENDQ